MKKIVFCGFGNLGKLCLMKLLEQGYHVSFILTHKERTEDSVDTFAKNKGIEYSYVDLRKHNQEGVNLIQRIKPSLLVSVNYRYIIPKSFYSHFDYALNIHGSLLPQYRGRTPHVWSIINGESESGITCHLIEESVDTGGIITQWVIPIEADDTGNTLLKKFEKKYPDILIEAINQLKLGHQPQVQNEQCASYYGKRTPDMGYIDFRKSATDVINFVRAQAPPYPGAYYYLLNGKKITINKLSISPAHNVDIPIGVIKKIEDVLLVACKNSILIVDDYKIWD